MMDGRSENSACTTARQPDVSGGGVGERTQKLVLLPERKSAQ